MQQEEIYYTIALTRLTGLNQTISQRLYQTMGSGKAVYEHRQEIGDVLADSTPRLRESLKNWDEALRRAAAEMEFVTQKGIRVLTMNDADYPQRLRECPDAPIVLFYKGSADLNQPYVVDIVGTRHHTSYGEDLVRRFVSDLRQQCPQVLIGRRCSRVMRRWVSWRTDWIRFILPVIGTPQQRWSGTVVC